MTYNPWRLLQSRPEISLRWEARRDTLGTWDAERSEIVLHPRQGQAQRRCSVLHELIHAERADEGECSDRIESHVQQEVARRLITLEALTEAVLFYGEDFDGIAESLWVDPETLRARLDHLHPAERGYVLRRLSMREDTA